MSNAPEGAFSTGDHPETAMLDQLLDVEKSRYHVVQSANLCHCQHQNCYFLYNFFIFLFLSLALLNAVLQMPSLPLLLP